MSSQSAKKIYRLTGGELEILKTSDPQIIMGYFTRRPGSDIGFQFDKNFTDEGKWQLDFALAKQRLKVVLAGVATGKTLGVMATSIFYSLLTPDFRFMHIAKDLAQATFGFVEMRRMMTGTPLEKMVLKIREQPRPYIQLAFYAGSQLMEAEFYFSGLGDDADAMNIFSWRGDWINIEEAVRIDDLHKIVPNLQTRLTGGQNGRPYMGILSLISNPGDNLYMWELFEKSVSSPDTVWACTVPTTANKNVTEEQVEAMYAVMDESLRLKYITGARGETEGGFYPKSIVVGGEDAAWGQIIQESIKNGGTSYSVKEAGYLGWVQFEYNNIFDGEPKEIVILGDPGISNAPARNSPVIQVWDATPLVDSTGPARMIAFWWGSGNGSITPFVNKFLYLMDKYKPSFAGVDSTATQKNTVEIINIDHVVNKGYTVDVISGMDFSGQKKVRMLTSLRFMLESKKLLWPAPVKGMRQIITYDLSKDTISGKIAQDVVATSAMAAYVMRGKYYFPLDQDPDSDKRMGQREDSTGRWSRHPLSRDADTAPIFGRNARTREV